MTTSVPRWLKLAIVPVLAAGAFWIDYTLKIQTLEYLEPRQGYDFAAKMTSLGMLVGPVLGAGVIAYPLARLYEAKWLTACALVIALIATYCLYLHTPDDALGYFVDALTPFLFAVFIPAFTMGAYRAFHGSRLLLAPTGVADTRHSNPLALKLLLLPLLAVSFQTFYDFWPTIGHGAINLVEGHAMKRVLLACFRIGGTVLFALAFAFPIARVYGRKALVVGAVVPLLTTWWWASDYYGRDGRNTFFLATRIAEIALLLVLPPLAAWRVSRRYRDTSLVIAQAN